MVLLGSCVYPIRCLQNDMLHTIIVLVYDTCNFAIKSATLYDIPKLTYNFVVSFEEFHLWLSFLLLFISCMSPSLVWKSCYVSFLFIEAKQPVIEVFVSLRMNYGFWSDCK